MSAEATTPLPDTDQRETQNAGVPWKWVIGFFLVSRLIFVLGLGLAGNSAVVDATEWWYQGLTYTPTVNNHQLAQFQVEKPFYSIFYKLTEVSDGPHHTFIAERGYVFSAHGEWTSRTIGYYPLFPMLAYGISRVAVWCGAPNWEAIVWTGLVLNHVLFFFTLVLLWRIVNKHAGPSVALAAMGLWALYPGTFFCSAFMSESAFLFLALLFFWLVEQKKWLWAAVITIPAGLSRIQSIFLAVPFIQALWQKQLSLRKWSLLMGLFLLGVSLFHLYLGWKFGNPWLYLEVQTMDRGPWLYRSRLLPLCLTGLLMGLVSWVWQWIVNRYPHHQALLQNILWVGLATFLVGFYGVSFSWPHAAWVKEWPLEWFYFYDVLFGSHENVSHLPGLIATLAAWGVFGLWHRYLPWPYKIYTLLHLAANSLVNNVIPNPRYLLAAFPLFWCIAAGLQRYPIALNLVLCLFGAGLFLLTNLFVSGRILF